MPEGFIVLGVISGAHGIRGEVKLRSFTEPPEAILSYPSLRGADGKAYALRQKGSAKNQLICTVEGITSRNDAELLKNKELGVNRSELPPAADDEFYLEDFSGLDVVLEDGTPYGTVVGMHNYGAGDILEIRKTDADDTELISFTHANVPEIDMTKRRLTLIPPEILS
tara:strand:+ start:101 stop:604 length:504 start_codon:yes stop_codon:yes gene_type:complete